MQQSVRTAPGSDMMKPGRVHPRSEERAVGRVCNRENAVPQRKVLIVEDSKLVHKMYDMMLRQYALVHAFNGQEALSKLGEHPDIDLILLDVNMPKMNGLEFLGRLRGSAAMASIPVIIISTEGKDEDRQRGVEAGATAYLTKPFRNEALLDTIARLLPASSA